ncbi:MAG: hypothetical protein ABJC09_12695 [Terriglobia bacterium]
MGDYLHDQNGLIGELEQKRRDLEKRAINDTINGLDRKMRSRIVMFMPREPRKVKSAYYFEKWKTAYLEQRPRAVKILELAREFNEPPPDLADF